MSQIDNHLKWCLKDANRLKKVAADPELAKQHLEKSQHNMEIMKYLEKGEYYDWALNVGFYAIYHCFLAILAKHGYESRNQSCSITALLKLIEDKKLNFDKDLILKFDTLDTESSTTKPTVRQSRETSTYGVASDINTKQLETLKEFILKVQRETIKVINE